MKINFQSFGRSILFILVFCLMLLSFNIFSGQAIAQNTDTSDSVRFKTLGCLYRAITALNNRNVRFKALQDELEDMHPIEPQSMDSVHLKENLAKVAKYLLFLNDHRAQLKKGVLQLADTIKLLEKIISNDDGKKSLEKFIKSYEKESEAFIQYSMYLSVMLTDIRHAIEFLQTVPMEHKGNDVVFNTDKSANEKYLDFESKISMDRMKVDEAIDRSIKLTESENKIIQETLALFNK
jgi:hypothetical protein